MTPVDFYAWRKNYGLTQERTAEQFRVAGTTIQNWESGATAIPGAVDDLCEIWGRRFRQVDPIYGPLTLVYFEEPSFVDGFGPRSLKRIEQRESCISNAAAIARVTVLSRARRLFDPQILERRERGAHADILWSTGEIEDALSGKDTDAPTIANLLRAIASEVCENPMPTGIGQNILTAEQTAAHKAKLEAEAEKLIRIAARETISDTSASEINLILAELRKLGPMPRDSYVSGIFQAFVTPRQIALPRRGLGLPSALGMVRWRSWRSA